MRKRIIGLFLVLLSIFVTTNVKAWEVDNLTLSNIKIVDNKIVSFDITFDLPEYYGEATSWIVVQKGEFDPGNPDEDDYGDFTDFGNINNIYNFSCYEDVINNEEFMKLYGVVGISPENNTGFLSFGDDYTHIHQSINVSNLNLSEDEEYNMYLWTLSWEDFYPDAYLGKLTIDGVGNFDVIDKQGDSGTIEGYYKVTFDTNGGSNVVDQTIKENDKIVEPEDPTKEGYVLEGWYTDPELTNKFDFDTPVTEEITLYANWVVEYKMLSDDQTYKLKSNVNIVFKAEGELSKVTGIMIDDKEVAESNYELESGSTILTLKSSYLDTLSVGGHKLTIKYNDGFASTNFAVKEADVTNPSTGDNIIYYVVLFSICLSSIIVCRKIKL